MVAIFTFVIDAARHPLSDGFKAVSIETDRL